MNSSFCWVDIALCISRTLDVTDHNLSKARGLSLVLLPGRKSLCMITRRVALVVTNVSTWSLSTKWLSHLAFPTKYPRPHRRWNTAPQLCRCHSAQQPLMRFYDRRCLHDILSFRCDKSEDKPQHVHELLAIREEQSTFHHTQDRYSYPVQKRITFQQDNIP